jgi:molybdopterin molybdotransferase
MDSEESVIAGIKKGQDTDMFITTGGVSLGDYDVVKEVLGQQGQINFWAVRMKPGKPVAFGSLNIGGKNIPHMGLPGNPVSAMVTFEILARPALLKMMGKKNYDRPVIEAIMESTVQNNDGRRVFTRVLVERRNGTYYARTTGPQESNILTSMSLANGLAVVPENVDIVRSGDRVNVIMLDWSGEEF